MEPPINSCSTLAPEQRRDLKVRTGSKLSSLHLSDDWQLHTVAWLNRGAEPICCQVEKDIQQTSNPPKCSHHRQPLLLWGMFVVWPPWLRQRLLVLNCLIRPSSSSSSSSSSSRTTGEENIPNVSLWFTLCSFASLKDKSGLFQRNISVHRLYRSQHNNTVLLEITAEISKPSCRSRTWDVMNLY